MPQLPKFPQIAFFLFLVGLLLVGAFPAFAQDENGTAGQDADQEQAQQAQEDQDQGQPDDAQGSADEGEAGEVPAGVDDHPGGVFAPVNEDEIPAISMGDAEPGLSEAARLLDQNFGHFLDRRPLGFDRGLVDVLLEDSLALYYGAVDLSTGEESINVRKLVNGTLVLIVLTLLLVFFLLIDRQATRVAHRLQAETYYDVSPWLTTASRKAILVAGRTVALAALIALSFFPIRATFGPTGWTLLLTDILVIFLVYRVVKTFLLTTLRLHPRDEETQAHFARLERFGSTVLWVSVFFLVSMQAIDRFEYHEQVRAFTTFGYRLTLAALPLYLLFIRDSVLALLPAEPEARVYRALRLALIRNYTTVLVITVVLLLFNAAGYISAATFLLTRGYAFIAIATIWFAALQRLHTFVERRTAESESDGDLPSPLLHTSEHVVITVGSLVILVVVARLLRIYEPLMAVLEIPLVTLGNLSISSYSLLSVALIIVATVLSIRLLKALLNAKVYPTLGVEIGAAYATNMLINYALVVVAFIMCLVALGVHLSAVMVVMASLGVGIGFGLQNITENLISGFILLFGRAVKKGDFITVNELYGRVDAVGARSVVVHTSDNVSMLIPSKEIVSGRIINWTFHDSIVRIHIPIGVSYDSDPTQVRQVLLETAKLHPDILADPAPDVWLVEFGDNSVDFELLIYFDCRITTERALRGKFNFMLWKALRDADIGIPFPQRDLHLKTSSVPLTRDTSSRSPDRSPDQPQETDQRPESSQPTTDQEPVS